MSGLENINFIGYRRKGELVFEKNEYAVEQRVTENKNTKPIQNNSDAVHILSNKIKIFLEEQHNRALYQNPEEATSLGILLKIKNSVVTTRASLGPVDEADLLRTQQNGSFRIYVVNNDVNKGEDGGVRIAQPRSTVVKSNKVISTVVGNKISNTTVPVAQKEIHYLTVSTNAMNRLNDEIARQANEKYPLADFVVKTLNELDPKISLPKKEGLEKGNYSSQGYKDVLEYINMPLKGCAVKIFKQAPDFSDTPKVFTYKNEEIIFKHTVSNKPPTIYIKEQALKVLEEIFEYQQSEEKVLEAKKLDEALNLFKKLVLNDFQV